MPKIPFWRTVGAAFGFIMEDWGRFVRIAAVWIAAGLAFYVVMIALFGTAAIGTMGHRYTRGDGGYSLFSLVFGIYRVLSGVAFAVAWHRAVLVGEVPATLEAARFARREWRFLLYTLLIGVIAIGVCILLAGIGLGLGYVAVGGKWLEGQGSDISPNPYFIAVAAGLFFVGFVTLLPFLARFSLGLPAIAIDEPRGVFGRSWHRGWHNGWRLIGGPAICAIPFNLVAGVIEALTGVAAATVAVRGPAGAIAWLMVFVFFALSYAASFLGSAAAVTFLSRAYRHLTFR